ncbi:DUF1127 domain-containing protein [Tranquillimonas alkanivorans]|uniref:YjiS-like domain-containing protein n=1 Tax=Tranquillimonas alkanivorans TaxID=441119 RepID=A0A1I5M865_9RHOB|nr:DUF1127 domain-containing protein [Tranquillimonas alkanivorans]SFP05715.1 protein of unknown function [Tranquillimonas alkanivorans]
MHAAASSSLYRPAHARRAGLLARVIGLHDVWRQRRRLATLEAHMLRDIGLTRDAAALEAKRPFWDRPSV